MKLVEVKIEQIPDSDPDTSYLEQQGFEERLEAYNRDEFGFIGVRAVAQLEIGGTLQTIATAGRAQQLRRSFGAFEAKGEDRG